MLSAVVARGTRGVVERLVAADIAGIIVMPVAEAGDEQREPASSARVARRRRGAAWALKQPIATSGRP